MEGDLERLEKRLQAELASLREQRDAALSAIGTHRRRVNALLTEVTYTRYRKTVSKADEELWTVLGPSGKEGQS